jgi:hypothetical protein
LCILTKGPGRIYPGRKFVNKSIFLCEQIVNICVCQASDQRSAITNRVCPECTGYRASAGPVHTWVSCKPAELRPGLSRSCELQCRRVGSYHTWVSCELRPSWDMSGSCELQREGRFVVSRNELRAAAWKILPFHMSCSCVAFRTGRLSKFDFFINLCYN